MNFHRIKLELFYLRISFLRYHQGWKYFYYKYFVAPAILRLGRPIEKPVNHPEVSLHVLTCHSDLVMLMWSLASFYAVSEVIGQLYVHDDGSLTERDRNNIKRLLPSCVIKDTRAFAREYASELKEHPVIQQFRTEYPEYILLKKLVDPYFVSDAKYRLIIDGDLVWFRRPDAIEQAILGQSPNPLMTRGKGVDAEHNVRFRDGRTIDPERAVLNSGIVLYRKDYFHLDVLAEYLKDIDTSHPSNRHFIEQAGYAYALQNPTSLPYDTYTIKQQVGEQTVVKHYTSPRRPLFYIEALPLVRKKIV